MTSGYQGYSVYCPRTNPQSSYSDALSLPPEVWYTSHIVARQTDEIKTNSFEMKSPKIILLKSTCHNIHIILRPNFGLSPHSLILMLFLHHWKSVIHHILLQWSSRWSWQIVNSQRRWISFQHFQHGNNDVCFSHKFPLSHNMNNHL